MGEVAAEKMAGRLDAGPPLAREDFEEILAHVAKAVTVRTPDGQVVYENQVAARLRDVELLDLGGRLLDRSELPHERVLAGADESELLVRFRPPAGDDLLVAVARAARICDDRDELRYVVSFLRVEDKALAELKAELISTVSHELRTPLAAINGAASMLRRDDIEIDDEQRAILLGVISGESDRLARTVTAILAASRLETGTLVTDIEPCDPTLLARDAIRAQRLHLPPQASLELDEGDALPLVAADPDKVRQVLVNLLDNAIKYSPGGGLVRLELSAAGGTVRFAVSDQGIGIPTGAEERVFEKFHRLDADSTRGVSGTGLGLYISRELVRRMHGRIWAASNAEGGSTFAFELPAAGDSPT